MAEDWERSSYLCRSAYRNNVLSNNRNYYYGFRLASSGISVSEGEGEGEGESVEGEGEPVEGEGEPPVEGEGEVVEGEGAEGEGEVVEGEGETTEGELVEGEGEPEGEIAPGSLYVLLGPSDAVVAGARWRREDTTIWRETDTVEPDLAPGTYQIEFKDIIGWDNTLQSNCTNPFG